MVSCLLQQEAYISLHINNAFSNLALGLKQVGMSPGAQCKE